MTDELAGVPAADRLNLLGDLLTELTDDELAKAWARCMRMLRERGLVRTSNTPVGDYAERVACARLGLERKGFSEKSVDALDAEGVRYQIKGRRLTPENMSRRLGAIRDIEQKPFDILLAVFFNEDLDMIEIWSIPCEVVSQAAYVARTNSTSFVLTKTRQRDPRSGACSDSLTGLGARCPSYVVRGWSPILLLRLASAS